MPMPLPTRIARLSRHLEVLPVLAGWFKDEWPLWYGPQGPGNAEHDLLSYANEGSLPIGIVAFRDGAPCAVAALKADSFASHAHLTPWAAAGFVVPELRGQGIGAALLRALELEARTLGHERIHCGTATAARLLRREGWACMETVLIGADAVGVYEKKL